MSDNDFLLFIDTNPVPQSLSAYFEELNITMAQRDTLDALEELHSTPLAILVDWSLLASQINQLRTFTQKYPIPFIIIHNSFDETICINVLEAGADDFIAKPLHARELHARIHAIARRIARGQKQEAYSSSKNALQFEEWKLLPSSRQLFHKNTEVPLSAGEYELLKAFVEQPQKALSRDFLLQITKNSETTPFDRRIDVQISRLRQKIEPNPKKPTFIKTIRNGGYLFTAEVMLSLD
jgi:two-component system OmpR family response regulator